MRTTMKKICAVLLSLIMVVGVMPFASFATEYPSVAPGEDVIITLDGVDVTSAIYSFTPIESGVYTFYCCTSDYDSCGYLWDADGNELAYNDDSDSSSNFRIIYDMTAGVTYLLKARFYNQENSGSMTVKVEKAVPATSIEIVGDALTDRVGAQHHYSYKVEPEGAYAGELTWTSDNESVVKIYYDSYIIFAGAGTANLTVTSSFGISDTVKITVLDSDEVTLGNPATAYISEYKNASIRFTAPEDGVYTFYSNGQKISSYACLYDLEMAIKAYDTDYEENDVYLQCTMSAGETFIFVLTSAYLSDIPFELGVGKKTAAEGISLSKTAVEGYVGGKKILVPVYEPVYADRESLLWESSNEAVAVVNDGVVEFISIGNATITATSENGFTASCEVSVKDYQTISRGETKTPYLEPGESMWYYFTPEEDGYYSFVSSSKKDTVAHLYDSTGETELASNDDSSYGFNFELVYYMEAGTVYLLETLFFGDSTSGELPVTAYMVDEENEIIHEVEEYIYDDYGHNGVCVLCGEDVSAEHAYGDGTECVCGKIHYHSSNSWEMNNSIHFGVCDTCHKFVEQKHIDDGNGICMICGREIHDCSVEKWNYDDSMHYGYCYLCGDTIVSEHDFDENGNCVCGYFEHEHDTNEFDIDVTHHCCICSKCKLEQGEWQTHEYFDSICECGKEYIDGLYFGEILVSDGQYLDNNGNVTSSQPDDGYAYFEDHVLTLHNFTYEGNGKEYFDVCGGLYTETDLTIVLEGTNKIHCRNGDAIHMACCSLTIQGDGELTVIADDNNDGIDVNGGDLVIESGTIFIEATDHGIEMFGDLLTINGGNFIINAGDDGMDIDGDIVINGGVFDINAEDNGIDGYYDIDINDGDFFIYTHDDNGIESNGGSITISGGRFEFATNYNGIACDYTVYLNGGSFVFDVGNMAIEAYDDITLSDAFMHYSSVYYDDYMVLFDGNDVVTDGIVQESDEIYTQIEKDWITLSEDDFIYTGDALKTPTVTVEDHNGNILIEGEDYTLSWSKLPLQEYGNYYLTVIGCGMYNGVKIITVSVEDLVLDGPVGDYFYADNVRVNAYRLAEYDGDLYYIGDYHRLAKNKTVYLSKEAVEGFTYADGTPLAAGYFTFGKDGKMQIVNGPMGDYFYRDNIRVNAYRLAEYNGDLYYIGDYHRLAKNKTIYLSKEAVEGFMYADGTPLAAGYFTFGEDGKMQIVNGPMGDYFYKDNVRVNAYRLAEYNGNLYYIGDYHRLAKNKTIYLSKEAVEGFTYADGTPLAAGYFTFGEDGTMQIVNGPMGDYFYRNNVRVNAYQLVEYNGDLYFISDYHKLIKNKTIHLGKNFVEGFTYADGTPLKAGHYTFDEEGKMVK